MLRNRLMLLLGLLMVASMVLAACGPTAATPEATAAPTGAATEAPEVPQTTRHGGWADALIFTDNPDMESAVAQIQAGEIDVYAMSMSDPNVFAVVKGDPNLDYTLGVGVFDAFLFNPVAEFNDGRLNPFGYPEIRAALHHCIDRNFLISEYMGGLGIPRFVTLTGSFPDYARYIDTIRAMEAEYAYNPTLCEQKITAKMEEIGAVKDATGTWTWNGDPVTIIAIIRNEDERQEFGNYICDALDNMGFVCDRQVMTRAEASPIWALSDAYDGEFHFYTAGWINNFVDRDEGDAFAGFYTDLGGPYSAYQERNPTPEFYDLAVRLLNNDFTSLDERDELFREALPMSMADSVVLHLVDTQSFMAFNAGIQTSFDLAANIAASYQWPYTMRWEGVEGGTIRIAQGALLVEPWNPIGGSNWVDDGMIQRATMDGGVLYDPYTGLVWPNMIESFELTAVEGLPIFQSELSEDWCTLTFAPSIPVPADAWYDWNADTQTWITVGEVFPDGLTANTKGVITYPVDFNGATWHDGSPVTVGDFLMNMIIGYDMAKETSLVYAEDQVSTIEAWLEHFKGMRITSTNPLVIETYDDLYAIDAELNVTTWWPAEAGFYPYGGASWDMMELGILGEAAGEMAFTAEKATMLEIDRTGFLAGPTFEVLVSTHLPACVADPTSCIPYYPTFSQFVTADEAATRFTNLQAFYEEYGHIWLGTGPYIIDGVFPTELIVTLKNNENYPFLADRWAMFGSPKYVVVDLDGPAQVTTGTEAVFDVFVTTREGDPYPADELVGVNWLLFGADGAMAEKGVATLVEDGYYTVTLSSAVTGDLAAGANKLEIAVSSLLIAVPGLGAYEFVTVAP